mgnify:CR=1 FL=1
MNTCQGLKPFSWNNRKVWVPKEAVLLSTKRKSSVAYWLQDYNYWVPGTLQGSEFNGKGRVQFRANPPATTFVLNIPTEYIVVEHCCFRHLIPLKAVILMDAVASQLHGLQDVKHRGIAQG